MNIVTIGGGTGQYHILQALRDLRSLVEYPVDITAIPATSDSGGSSGVFRLEHGIVAPGDISQCIFGLHPEPELVAPMLGSQRFKRGNLKGHTTRNIIVASYFEQYGSTQEAMDMIRKALRLEGRIAPVTFTDAHLKARLRNGRILEDENSISSANLVEGGGIEKIWLDPQAVPNPSALKAIAEADVIVVCPGTIACSILPNFIVPGMAEALRNSRALKVYVVNLMNRRGHVPENWSVLNYVEYLESFVECKGFFNAVLCNTQPLSPEQISDYEDEKVAVPLISDLTGSGRNLFAMSLLMNGVAKPSEADRIGGLRSLVRHDPEKVASAFRLIFQEKAAQTDQWLILDLDRTIFDNEAFKLKYRSRLPALMEGKDRFTVGELSKFVYPDVVPTLLEARERKARIALLTQDSGMREFQEEKIRGTGIHGMVDRILYVPKGGLKGAELVKALGRDIRGVMVDDMPDVIESMASRCPRVRFIRIERSYPGPGDVTSLSEALKFLK